MEVNAVIGGSGVGKTRYSLQRAIGNYFLGGKTVIISTEYDTFNVFERIVNEFKYTKEEALNIMSSINVHNVSINVIHELFNDNKLILDYGGYKNIIIDYVSLKISDDLNEMLYIANKKFNNAENIVIVFNNPRTNIDNNNPIDIIIKRY